jgi:hypothetical protein
MAELEPWSARYAFASLQATAKDFAGLNNARVLIREAKNIRFLQREQVGEQGRARPITARRFRGFLQSIP